MVRRDKIMDSVMMDLYGWDVCDVCVGVFIFI